MSTARATATRALEAAASAWTTGRPREAIESLREAWRVSLDPSLAELYELLLDSVRAPALAGANPSERAQAWRERAATRPGDPLELPNLIAEPWHPELPEIDRLRALAAWSPDPLLASDLVRRLRLPVVPRGLPGAEQVAIETTRLLAAQLDVRQLPLLERVAREAGASSEHRRQLRGALASLESLGRVRLDARGEAARAPLDRRARALQAERERGAALLDEVYADPDADVPRFVYADWLTSRGDPRGEFIGLQLERHARRGPPSARELELLERHRFEWSGILHGVLGVDGRVFERGFVAEASIETPPLERELIDVPEWTTLRSLDGHLTLLLAAHARLGRLRTLYGFLRLESFVAMRAGGRLEAVERYECSLADPNLGFDTPLGLRALLVRRAFDDQLLALLDSPACEGLEELGVYYDGSALGGWTWSGDHRERPALRARYELLRERLPAHVQRLRMIDGRSSRAIRPEGCELLFERDTSGALRQLQLSVHRCRKLDPAAIVELLAGVGLRELASVRVVEVDASVCDEQQLCAALTEAGAPLIAGAPVVAE